MPILDDINEKLRDFVRFDAQHPLPTGDPTSGIFHISKSDLRQLFMLIAQTQGDPDALQGILSELASKPDGEDVIAGYLSRADAVAEVAALPSSIRNIIVREDTALVMRSRFSAGGDPLFATGNPWGVNLRLDVAAETAARSALIAADTLEDSLFTWEDRFGFVQMVMALDGSLRGPSQEINVGGLRIAESTYDGVAATDERGFVLAAWGAGSQAQEEAELSATPPIIYTAPVLAAAEGETISLHAHGLLDDRRLVGRVSFGLLGASGHCVSGLESLTVRPSDMGAAAELVALPPEWNGGAASYQELTVAMAPVPAVTPTTQQILMIGDSITNRQGAAFVSQNLTAWGYLPQFIGTINSSADPTNTNSITGPLSEAREGWESGDFTYAITDRVSIVAPGDEAAYLSSAKTVKWPQNPFLRVSTGGDVAAEIRNGHVFDFGYYLTRFSLATPDIVCLGLGVNDERDRTAADVRAALVDAYRIMIRKIRQAAPTATIIIWMPAVSRDPVRDQQWRDEYIPMISGIMDLIAELDDARIILAPIWAMAPAVGGYARLGSPADPTTGTVVTSLADTIHPVGGARAATFHALSGYLAAVMAGTL